MTNGDVSLMLCSKFGQISTIISSGPNFGLTEPKFGTGSNFQLPILSFNFKIRYKYILQKKNDFPFYFWLIFNETPSRNVVAMARRKGPSFIFWFQNITDIFLGKGTKCQENFLCCSGVTLQKSRGEG